MKPIKIIVVLSVFISLFAFKCNQTKECDGAICTQEFRTLTITSKMTNGAPYVLDFVRTTDLVTNATVLQNSDPETVISPSTYVYFSDALKNNVPLNGSRQFKVEGFYNNQLKFTTQVTVSADCCHIEKVNGIDSIVVQ